MPDTLKPKDAAELRDAVAWAVAEDVPLEVIGAGSKRGYGRPVEARARLDVSNISGVTDYEPEELVLTARAATPLRAIEDLLAQRRQFLAFEPADYGPLLGGAAGSGTLAGALACNLAGPRRVKAGAARDHFLGFAGVSGRGETFKAGGRVVKNVTGYDVCKLIAGSFGTLAVMTEVTVKVMPAPDKTRTVLIFGLDAAGAVATLADALNSPWEVSGAAYLPQAVAKRSAVDFVRGAGAAVAAVRVEGTGLSVAARCDALRKQLAPRGALEELHSMNSAELWREIGDVVALLPDAGKAIWRVSVPPTTMPALVADVSAKLSAEFFGDWGCGLVWLAVAPDGDGGAAIIRAQIAAGGGHATLLRAPDGLRATVPVFEPQPSALAGLTARTKDAFDPKRVLNRGRMYLGV
jgi:glycolate oxidase FAD binding subunit